jgi:hypothetical protein
MFSYNSKTVSQEEKPSRSFNQGEFDPTWMSILYRKPGRDFQQSLWKPTCMSQLIKLTDVRKASYFL